MMYLWQPLINYLLNKTVKYKLVGFQFYFIVSIVQMITCQWKKHQHYALFSSIMVFLTVPASIKGAPCQKKYKAVLLEIFNGKFMRLAFLSSFFICTSCRCNTRNERKRKERDAELGAFPQQQPHGSSPEVVIFTVSIGNQMISSAIWNK